MASIRRIPAGPGTVVCQRCSMRRNRLSVYPTESGPACFACLHEAPASASPDRPTVCPQPGCGRLPAHRGEHRATLQRRPKAA